MNSFCYANETFKSNMDQETISIRLYEGTNYLNDNILIEITDTQKLLTLLR